MLWVALGTKHWTKQMMIIASKYRQSHTCISVVWIMPRAAPIVSIQVGLGVDFCPPHFKPRQSAPLEIRSKTSNNLILQWSMYSLTTCGYHWSDAKRHKQSESLCSLWSRWDFLPCWHSDSTPFTERTWNQRIICCTILNSAPALTRSLKSSGAALTRSATSTYVPY